MVEPVFPVVTVEPAWVIDDEAMGSKEKFWVHRPADSQPWLFKFSRWSAGTVTGEHWAEKLGAECAALLGVDAAPVELATFGGHWGSLSRQFDALGDGQTILVHGNELLAGHVTGYDRNKQRKQSDHTVANILAAVHGLFPDSEERALAEQQLVGYVLLDALILNTDRHHENWAVLRTTRKGLSAKYRMAPSFDHASSLARNEPPGKLRNWLTEPWRPEWYAMRATGGVYVSRLSRKGASPLSLAVVLGRRWPHLFQHWAPAIGRLREVDLTAIVDRIPTAAMAPQSKSFCVELLRVTLARIRALTLR